MRAQIESRLTELRSELEKGQLQAQHLQSQLTVVHETVLRISGAIMVLEETLSRTTPAALAECPSRDVAGQSHSSAA